MTNPAQLRAEADAADRQADVIYDRIHAAAVPDAFGARPLIPAGREADAARAGELRSKARFLREEAADLDLARAPAPKPKTVAPDSRGGAASPPLSSTGAGVGSTPPPPPPAKKPDPAAEIEAAVKRILASDGPAEVLPSGDAEVDAVAARIAASDAEVQDEADAIAERIAAA
jgi:hypothetical protein